jgi:hypothetical protein
MGPDAGEVGVERALRLSAIARHLHRHLSSVVAVRHLG